MDGHRSARLARSDRLARRLRRLPEVEVLGKPVRVADRPWSRLLGLAGLPLERAGAGLLIPHCRSVHTFGMRFALDVVFLDDAGEVVAVHRRVGPVRIVSERRAIAALELPVAAGAAPGARA